MVSSDELVDFLADQTVAAPETSDSLHWNVLVVDDDEEVHEATRFTLQRLQLCGRPLRLLHAHSAAEATTVLRCETDIAVILLDVVMESPDAGLRLIRWIRDEQGLSDLRIILRTGQPGHAPELQVIRDYDINDYKTKAELTHTRLVTAMIASLRSYEQLRAIDDNRRGLELIVSSAPGLMQARTLRPFAESVLARIAALLKVPGDGLVCAAHNTRADDADAATVYIVAAAGSLAGHVGQRLDHLHDPEAVAAIKDCVGHRAHSFGQRHAALYLHDQRHEAAVFVRTEGPLAAVSRQLAEVFAANVSAAFGNLKLVERLNHVAYHDPLTKLPNRTRFIEELTTAGALARPGQVVCLIDIDRFTDINTTLGHAVGDQLLIAVAQRLAYACRDCRLARIGADAFGLIGPESRLAPERLMALLQDSFLAGDQQLSVSATLGYCRISQRETGDTLFTRADMALTQARFDRHVTHLYFSPEMEEQTRWRLELIRRLRNDFHAGRLAVWYQPQVSLADDSLVGFEALARWPELDQFVHPPTVFIPLAEDSGLIVDIGDWVLDQSCATFRRLRDAGHTPRHIAVNVSMPQFRLPDFPERVARTLAAHNLPASVLELEITESVLLKEPLVVMHNLEALRRAGVQISIDDFGTGYSSLSYLRQLPIDCLKIDRSFVADIDSGKGDLFAETILTLAHKLGVTTVAEGVETETQLKRLRQLGCDSAQGFFYAEAMPADALPDWIERRQQRLH